MLEFLVDLLNEQYNSKIVNEILDGYNKKRKVSFRVNTIKTTVKSIEEILKEKGIQYEKVNWYKDAFIIQNAREKDIEELEIYKEGKIYVQSLSSMLPPIILQPKEDEDILDMAAAPGGKTTQIATMTQNKAHITACEMNTIRLEKLKYNIEKQGVTASVYVMKQDSRNINEYFSFDRILLDSPCSGSGTLNFEDKKIEKYFTKQLIEKSSKIQEILLKKALKLLKPGHELVYSTCSILQQENEDIVNKVLKQVDAQIVPIELESRVEIPLLPTKIDGTICVKPTELYEGFFVAKIRKN